MNESGGIGPLRMCDVDSSPEEHDRVINMLRNRENYGHLIMERNTNPKSGRNRVYVFYDGMVVMEIGILESDGQKVKQSYSAPKDYRIVREEVLNRRERKAVLEWKVQNGNN